MLKMTPPQVSPQHELHSQFGRPFLDRQRAFWLTCILTALLPGIIIFAISRHAAAHDDALTPLIATAEGLDHRFILGRLVGFPHKRFQVGRGQAADLDDSALLRLFGEVGRTLESAGRSSDVISLHTVGVAALLGRNEALSIERLQSAAESSPADARNWSDLSAALLEQGRKDNAWMIARALAAAERAQHIDISLPDASFNYALALEELHLDASAAAAYERYLLLDSGSQWSTEARERIHRLRRPTSLADWQDVKARLDQISVAGDSYVEVPEIVDKFRQQCRGYAEFNLLSDWGDLIIAGTADSAVLKFRLAREIANTIRKNSGDAFLWDVIGSINSASPSDRLLLARGHKLYRQARKLQHERQPRLAASVFQAAHDLFKQTGSPMAQLTDYWIANCETDGANAERALSLIQTAEHRVPSHYINLHALLAWQEGVLLNRFGLSNEALAAYSNALQRFAQLGERDNVSYMMNATSAMNANLGRVNEAWTIRRDLFRAATQSGQAGLLQMALDTTGRTELAMHHIDVAHVFFMLASAIATTNARLRFDARLWSSLTAARLDWASDAARDLADAGIEAAKVVDPGLRAAIQNDLRLGVALLSSRSEQRASLLTDYINDAGRRADTFLLPNAYVERARAYRALGRRAQARSDLIIALTEAERRSAGMTAPDFRDSYFATYDDVFRELVELVDENGSAEDILATSERWRRTSIFPSSISPGADFDVHHVVQHVPSDVVIVEYLVLRGRLLVVAITRLGVTVERIRVSNEVLGNAAAGFTSDVRAEKFDADRAHDLYRMLIAPIAGAMAGASTLVVVADPPVDAIPFAALLNPQGRFLIEDLSIVFASGAGAFVDATRHGPLSRHPKVVIVGNPSPDQHLFPLVPLAGAEDEAVDVAKLYGVRPLLGRDATKAHVLADMKDAEVIHVASHAVTNPTNPRESFLVLSTADRNSGALYLHEIAELSLNKVKVAVLAGCRTAESGERSHAMRNLALAFVTAGAESAVGSSWDLDDRPAQEISVALHRLLVLGIPPVRAVREVQLALMRSASSSRVRSPAVWSAIRVYGAGL